MQAALEDVLKEKEGELKLYQRFLNLRAFCEEEIFPSTDVPLRRHIEGIKDFIEQLIPDPRERAQEMFSGEIFVLLCLLYLHDVGAVTSYEWNGNDDILNNSDKSTKTLLINKDLATRLDIPESAIEIVNSLIFYPTIKRIPTEWEIREGSGRAIIRNARMLEHIFSFSHLVCDIFPPDLNSVSLRRFEDPNLRLHCGTSCLSVDSREGFLFIKCLPEIPYQLHLLGMVRGYVESAFRKFREAVNGRLGFQYRSIVWETGEASVEELGFIQRPDLPLFYSPRHGPDRWGEAAVVLDTLFKSGHVIVTGPAGSGKTTLMESFVAPQLSKISKNVFWAEVWESPVSELRDVIALAIDDKQTGSSDMVSLCNKLGGTGPCFFVLDCCERLQSVEEGEKEKLKRFVDFCLGTANLYLIILGDKEAFFEWYQPFKRISLSAVFEVRKAEGEERRLSASGVVSGDLLRETIDDILKASGNKGELREVVASLVGGESGNLVRCSAADIRSDTGLPLIKIVDYLAALREKGIIKEHRSFDSTRYALSSRHLVEPLREYLKLSEFDEKREIRAAVGRARREDAWISPETLDAVERWAERLAFPGEEMGLVLASQIHHGRSPEVLLDKFENSARLGLIRGDMIVRLLGEEDVDKRKSGVRLLSRIRDDHMVNELLSHLKREEDRAVKGLILETLINMGKKKTLVALMRTLSDMDDRQWKIQVIGLLANSDPFISRDALLILAEAEKDPETLDAIEKAFSKLEESL